jgi:hypothetical protein
VLVGQDKNEIGWFHDDLGTGRRDRLSASYDNPIPGRGMPSIGPPDPSFRRGRSVGIEPLGKLAGDTTNVAANSAKFMRYCRAMETYRRCGDSSSNAT